MKVKKADPLQSKWYKTKLLLQSGFIKRYIPDTRRFSRSNLEQMIYSYGMIYVKPERGTYGNGVIRAERGERGALPTSMRRRSASLIRSKPSIKVWRRKQAAEDI